MITSKLGRVTIILLSVIIVIFVFVLLSFSYLGRLIIAASIIVTLPEIFSFVSQRYFAKGIEIPGTMSQTMKDDNVKLEYIQKKTY